MKTSVKIALGLLAAVVVISLLFYLHDNVGLWLSRIGTYITVIAASFAAGWLLGRTGRRKSRDESDEHDASGK